VEATRKEAKRTSKRKEPVRKRESRSGPERNKERSSLWRVRQGGGQGREKDQLSCNQSGMFPLAHLINLIAKGHGFF
jgi:hypothetical protein